MQSTHHVSLNSIRVFEVVARHQAIKSAALELNLTPGAVSHRIKALEEALGIALFVRRNNAISLTGAGSRFHEDSVPGLSILANAITSVHRQSHEIVLRVGISLATRWLIPALERYKQENRNALVRLETSHEPDVQRAPHIDLAITYIRAGDTRPPGDCLFKEVCRPVASPVLLEQLGYRDLGDIGSVPAIQSAFDNWDWRRWTTVAGIAYDDLKRGDMVDTDDIAIHGAVARMGMAIMPSFLTRQETDVGSLVELPDAPAFDSGEYWVLEGPAERATVAHLRRWLLKAAKDT